MDTNTLPFNELTAITPVDGRYRLRYTALLAQYVSEFALIRNRLRVECAYLLVLAATPEFGMRKLTAAERALIEHLPDITVADAELVKQIETTGWGDIPATNHDVKAIEYFIKIKLANSSLKDILEIVHFALTSEDVNSVAYALCARGALEQVLLPRIEAVRERLEGLAVRHFALAMLARTHGQAATPTTFGKEMRVFETRLVRQIGEIRELRLQVKWGGASGNYNAHTVAASEVDWPGVGRAVVRKFNTLDNPVMLELNDVTTQIEPHDSYAELCDSLKRVNTILLDLSQDIWRYISDAWISQKSKAGEVGSSAMPHKVNPIDFENAEGNLGVANALYEFFSRKLPVSRLQRDLSDSTVLRVFGTAFGHTLIALRSLERGLDKISPNERLITDVLSAHPEVLSEAIQTVLRKEGIEAPYEKLKELTRGKDTTLEALQEFIKSLDIPKPLQQKLLKLRPENYIGIASELARG